MNYSDCEVTRIASGSEILVDLTDFDAVLSNSMEYRRTKSVKEARTSHGQSMSFGSPVVKLDSLSVLAKVGSSVVAFQPSLDSQEILQFADKVSLSRRQLQLQFLFRQLFLSGNSS